MPPTKSSPSTGKGLWVGIAIVLVLAIAAAVYFWPKPAPTPPEPAPAPVATLPAPIPKKHIYSETASPKADIAAALLQANREHKRVIVDFGGDWCGDCQVLDIYFHQAPNAELLDKNFVLVHVWVGHIDTNLDIPDRYGVAIRKGVPALAVLAPNGKVVYAQKLGEFENMRKMESSSVTEFLNQWKS